MQGRTTADELDRAAPRHRPQARFSLRRLWPLAALALAIVAVLRRSISIAI